MNRIFAWKKNTKQHFHFSICSLFDSTMSISLDGLSNDELSALRAYVTANDDEKYLNLTPGIVQITLTHNYLKQKMVDLRVSLYMTVYTYKFVFFINDVYRLEIWRWKSIKEQELLVAINNSF